MSTPSADGDPQDGTEESSGNAAADAGSESSEEGEQAMEAAEDATVDHGRD